MEAKQESLDTTKILPNSQAHRLSLWLGILISLRRENRNVGYAKAVLQLSLDGKLIAEHASLGAAERTGITRYSIRQCISGKIEMAGGYIWRLKELTAGSFDTRQNL